MRLRFLVRGVKVIVVHQETVGTQVTMGLTVLEVTVVTAVHGGMRVIQVVLEILVVKALVVQGAVEVEGGLVDLLLEVTPVAVDLHSL
jgi:hypothetical protein